MKKCVIIFDASPRHTIEIVRSLHKKGIKIVAFASENLVPVKYSKYVSQFYRFSKPNNYSESMNLINKLNKIQCEIIIPSGLWGFYFLSKYKKYFNVNVPVVDFLTFNKAFDKRATIKESTKINIPVPKTMFITKREDLNKIPKDFKFPIVLKAAEEWGSVKYANNIEEVYDFFNLIEKQFPDQIKNGKFPMVQEYINGEGYGYYALMDHGKLKADFMHKRLREFPPTGGPSSLAKSFYDYKLKEYGEKILKHMNWHGVAMVEFKKDNRDGKYKIMEINPKFWGSLALSKRSGIDFPLLLYKVGMNQKFSSITSFKGNVKFQWFTLDLAHCISKKNLTLYIKTLLNRSIYNDIYIDDIMPSIILFIKSIKTFYSKEKKFPHGRPIINKQ